MCVVNPGLKRRGLFLFGENGFRLLNREIDVFRRKFLLSATFLIVRSVIQASWVLQQPSG
jgi:hypothetical protein